MTPFGERDFLYLMIGVVVVVLLALLALLLDGKP